jgi:NAD(P)-dependent dehydrogenase (short-subunit alcohol dehydrogenase family)
MASRKSIVITGASSGFGAAFAHALADDGHQVFICARRTDLLSQVAAKSPSIVYARCDVSRESEVKNYFQKIRAQTESIDVLIHCAATLAPIGKFNEVRSDEWITALTANVFGAYAAVRHAVPLMKPERRPRILILSGKAAFEPMPNISAYAASKAAIVRLVETLAVELVTQNVAINAIAPGFAPTGIHKATLSAGPERGGEHFRVTEAFLASWSSSMDIPIECIRYMISDASAKLTGKTISARYDPWGEPEFNEMIDEIASSCLYTTQRSNIEHVGNSTLRKMLKVASDRKQSKLGIHNHSRSEK